MIKAELMKTGYCFLTNKKQEFGSKCLQHLFVTIHLLASKYVSFNIQDRNDRIEIVDLCVMLPVWHV